MGINNTFVVTEWLNRSIFFSCFDLILFCQISNGGQKNLRYWRFIFNRVLRIFPLMVFLVFIVICCSKQTSTPIDILRIFTLQLNTGNAYTGWGHDFYPSGPIWTIAVEFQFYFLFPFIIFKSLWGKIFSWFNRFNDSY
jgi:peptidoglycan/LPS O-acetylase OafA/YrhL